MIRFLTYLGLDGYEILIKKYIPSKYRINQFLLRGLWKIIPVYRT